MIAKTTLFASFLLVVLFMLGVYQSANIPHSTLAGAATIERTQQQLNICMNDCMRACVTDIGTEAACSKQCNIDCKT